MERDELFPAFHFPVYYASAAEEEMVRYPAESFFSGMNVKLERLLRHIDNCILKYGRDQVLSL
jgi:hypothetical protein